MSGSALFLSPHLDDVAFSCGGTLIRLVSEGWRVTLCTAFTASISNPKGFALACQLDKGLPADVDYMALRRLEDLQFAAFAHIDNCLHLPFPEAPHRGYESAADLFQGIHAEDLVWQELSNSIAEVGKDFEWIFAPQGLGNHVDHLQIIMAVQESVPTERTVWYCDTPYAIRNPQAKPASLLAMNLSQAILPIDLSSKIAACSLYHTQVPFQFGSDKLLREKLESFHSSETGYIESFLFSTEANTSPLQSRTMTRGS